MLTIFKRLAEDIRGYNVQELYGEFNVEAIERLPDLRFYPFDEMIHYAKNNWLNRLSRDCIIKDLTILKKLMAMKEERQLQNCKLDDAVILFLPDAVLDHIVEFNGKDKLKALFNPINQSAKTRINESFKRIHTNKRSNA
jgi:hypothetical protein